MALYVTRPRRDEVRIGRGLPSGDTHWMVQDIALKLYDEIELISPHQEMAWDYFHPLQYMRTSKQIKRKACAVVNKSLR